MITGELRGLLADINWTEIIDHMQTSAGAIVDGDWLDAWHEAASNACDAIDAVHANLERKNDRLRQERDMRAAMAEEAYNRGYDEGFASADDWLGQHEDAMAEHGWVRLPVDADGVPWHIGDVTENGQKVGAMGLNKHGWHFVGTVNDIDPAIHRHHHPDTWERIIEDAIRGDGGSYGCLEERFNATVPPLVARCKALCERTREEDE